MGEHVCPFLRLATTRGVGMDDPVAGHYGPGRFGALIIPATPNAGMVLQGRKHRVASEHHESAIEVFGCDVPRAFALLVSLICHFSSQPGAADRVRFPP